VHPLLSGSVLLAVQHGVPFDAGRFLSIFGLRLEQSGAAVKRHAATITFENLRLWNASRAVAWCSGQGEVVDGVQGPVLQYSLRFADSAWLMAAALGAALVFYLWWYRSWTILLCLSPGLVLISLVHGVQAVVLMLWFRWTARQTSLAVTYRPPRAAA